jgi:alpha-galactosidase
METLGRFSDTLEQAKRVWQSGQQDVWSRELAGGDTAVAVFNCSPQETKVSFRWADAGIPKAPSRIRDLWRHTEQKQAGPQYSVEVSARWRGPVA